MGFLAGLPWGSIAKGGAAILGGWFGGKKAQQSAMARTPEEQTALAGAQGAAGGLGRMGQSLLTGGQAGIGQGTGMLGQAGDYWRTLLGGNRAAMAQATAAPRGAITEQYRGAERGLERSGLRGATRDLASAELSRQRAGQIAGLTTGVQPMAAEQLAGVGGQIGQLGLGQAGLGVGAAGAGANAWTRLLGEGAENRRYGRAEGEKFGSGLGGLIFDILSGIGRRGTPSYGQRGGITSTGPDRRLF